MKRFFKEKRKTLIIILSIVLIIGMSVTLVLLFKKTKADNTALNSINVKKFEAMERDTKISVDSSGNLQITRNRVKDICELEDDSWTILIYMCGVDSPRRDYSSEVLDNIRKCNINNQNIKKFNVVLQTGGNDTWFKRYEWLGTDEVKRCVLDENHKWALVEDFGKKNMGDHNNFIDFLQWGLTTYPAEHTMVILNNHGGEGLTGLCFDPYNDNDYLSINEIEYSFAKVKKHMKKPLDLVVLDACSTGSLEYANALAPYANYMVGSADYISAYGFDHGTCFNKILRTPDMDPKELSRVYVNAGYEKYAEKNASFKKAGLASYDLTKLDPLLVELNSIFKQVYENASKDKKAVKQYYKLIKDRVYTYSSAYQKDIGSFIHTVALKNIDITKAEEALSNYVNNWWKGGYVSEKSEVTSFMFLDTNMAFGKGALNITRNVAFSPYYMNMIEIMSHIIVNKDLDNFKKYDWSKSKYFYEETFDFMNYSYIYGEKLTGEEIERILKSNPDYVADGFVQNWIDNIDNKPIVERVVNDKIEVNYEDNNVTTVVAENVQDTEKAYNTIYAKIGDTQVCLGENAEATYDKESATVTTNFKGEWLMLGDGQLLTTYIEQKTDEYTIYYCPVYAKDMESTLYIKVSKDGVEPINICYSPKDGEYNNRFYEINSSVSFTPIYDIWNEEKQTYDTEYGEEYTIKGTNDFLYTILDDGDYSYSTVLDNSLGTLIYSKPKEFTMKDNVITFK